MIFVEVMVVVSLVAAFVQAARGRPQQRASDEADRIAAVIFFGLWLVAFFQIHGNY